jgi:hypothetical protein
MRASFKWWRFDPEDVTAIGGHVVVVGRFHAQDKDSGIEIDRLQSRLWTVRGGTVVRYQWFDGPLEAAVVARELG